jgi:hypothetical protein
MDFLQNQSAHALVSLDDAAVVMDRMTERFGLADR